MIKPKKNLVYWVEVWERDAFGDATKKEFVGEYKTHAETNKIIHIAHEAEAPRKGLYSLRRVDLNKVASRKGENKY